MAHADNDLGRPKTVAECDLISHHLHRFGGVTANLAKFQEISGQLVNPDLGHIEMTGDLLLVIIDTVPETYGDSGLHLPDKYRSTEKMGVGYVLAAGLLAGRPNVQAMAIGPTVSDPTSLLYCHVIFGAHTGMPLRMSVLDRKFDSQSLIIKTRDVRAIDWTPKDTSAPND